MSCKILVRLKVSSICRFGVASGFRSRLLIRLKSIFDTLIIARANIARCLWRMRGTWIRTRDRIKKVTLRRRKLALRFGQLDWRRREELVFRVRAMGEIWDGERQVLWGDAWVERSGAGLVAKQRVWLPRPAGT